MAQLPIILAISDFVARRRIRAAITELDGYWVSDEPESLMETYNSVEFRGFCLVILSHDYTEQPEFDVMRGIFSAFDVRWLVIETLVAGTQVERTSHGKSDIFSIRPDIRADSLKMLLDSVTQNAVAPFQQSPKNTGLPTSVDADCTILIGASTGGVDALLSVLSGFPANCPPTLVVQHTGVGFGSSLAGLLNRQCRAEVRLVEGRTPIKHGTILLGAGARRHLTLVRKGSNRFADLVGDEPQSGHLPSIDVLFRSACAEAKSVRAALLTGMGRDGADGMKALRDKGAFTVAQDRNTSVVYGMPKAAAEIGAACRILPIGQIGAALLAPQTHAIAGR